MTLPFHLLMKRVIHHKFGFNSRLLTSNCEIAHYSIARSEGLFRHTPLIKIKQNGVLYHFKLENLQYSGSFKDRGIGYMIHQLLAQNPISPAGGGESGGTRRNPISHVICSSGGNAGLAAAFACQKLNIPIDIYCPKTTLDITINKMKIYGAKVNVIGENWNEADNAARAALNKINTAVYIPPFDHPLIFYGNSSLIDEIRSDADCKIDAIVVSCGGGGLLSGVLQGCKRFGMYDTDILVAETEGAASYAAAKKNDKPTSIQKISTIATTLGALCVTEEVMKYKDINTISVVVTDRQALMGCLGFANDYRLLVEPACAGLSIIYDSQLNQKYIKDKYKNVVVIVCGGSSVNIDLLNHWKKTVI